MCSHAGGPDPLAHEIDPEDSDHGTRGADPTPRRHFRRPDACPARRRDSVVGEVVDQAQLYRLLTPVRYLRLELKSLTGEQRGAREPGVADSGRGLVGSRLAFARGGRARARGKD
jgi:hypothetical protein